MDIPAVVIDRLPLYARVLESLEHEGQALVSSKELGKRLGVTPAQIRKDLSYFGRFGKQGRGYNVHHLSGELRNILGLDRPWRIALVGIGQLGRAILGYQGFSPQGFKIVLAFDSNPVIIGREIAGLKVRDVAQLERELERQPVDIGIVAVPEGNAQEVIDALVRSNVQSILNYAPMAAQAPPGVHIKRIDPVLALQSMTYYLKDTQVAPLAAS